MAQGWIFDKKVVSNQGIEVPQVWPIWDYKRFFSDFLRIFWRWSLFSVEMEKEHGERPPWVNWVDFD